ncbi:MAG TPA: SseB family protein [Oligoflexia bacterium]|nr:SseB family protein [Oligoflexia bacterium]HMP48291.1 SseB family protein [Oligoflexia bacterium]
MQLQEDFSPDPVNSIENRALESAIRAVLYSNFEKNHKNFIRTLLNSTLILLTENPIRNPEGKILKLDEEGYGYYSKGTNIPLVQLNDETGRLILPVFSASKYVHAISGLSAFHGLAVPALQALEIFKAAESQVLSLNPGSQEHLDIDRYSLLSLISELKEKGVLSEESGVVLNSHS